MEENIDLMEGNYYSTFEVMEFENYYIEMIEQQQEQIEILKLGFQFTTTLISVLIGAIVIIGLLRSVFRHVGN